MKYLVPPEATLPPSSSLPRRGGPMSTSFEPAGTTGSLTIRPWPDSVIDSLGHDPRSHYVETYWLGILGPLDHF